MQQIGGQMRLRRRGLGRLRLAPGLFDVLARVFAHLVPHPGEEAPRELHLQEPVVRVFLEALLEDDARLFVVGRREAQVAGRAAQVIIVGVEAGALGSTPSSSKRPDHSSWPLAPSKS